MADAEPAIDPNDEKEEVGSGAHALAGYDYQVDVSIWLALDLLLANKVAQSIELEPASEEDIEAELTESEPGRLATHVASDGYKLVVQAKRRSGDAWTVAGVNALLKHGGTNRLSAARRLADPKVRYLLVTSAGLNGAIRGLSVGRAGNWPKRSGMPSSTGAALPADAAGRVGIIGNLDEERLVGEIKRLIVERFGVPNSRWIECLKKLREEARLRVTRHVGGGKWHRDDLGHIIREHDGYLAASPQLENYVYPKNWDALRASMESPKYAAFIIGQSGTGKTLATSKLYEILRQEIPGLTRVPIRSGPQQLRDDRTPVPVLYDIEDPWGRYDFDPSSRPWNDQLGRFLMDATHDRRIVVTSRRDVGVSSGSLKTVEDWLVPLEVEHYGPDERQNLYRTRIETLPRDIQTLATGAESQVLDELASPLEIEKYFDALRISGRPESAKPMAFIRAAINRAQEESIELTVVQQIEERGDVAAAAALWGLLKASDKLSIRAVRSLEVDLAARDRRFEKGITPLIDFFAAARNLRVGEGDATYYHPRVESGIATALKRAVVPASLALCALIETLTDPESPDPVWGAGVSARILEAIKRLPELTVTPKTVVQNAVDGWIDQQASDPATNIGVHLRIAGTVGSQASVGAEFARYISHRRDLTFASLMYWTSPGHPQSWYDRMLADPQTMTIASRFVREVLPEDRTHFGKEFVADLDRIAPGLTPVYLEAAAGIVHRGYDPVVETLAEGALRDLTGFESIVDAAVAELTPTDRDLAKLERERLAFINGVYSEEYAEHMAGDDEGHTAGELLRAYVQKVRNVKGWRSLIQHRHADRLTNDWMRSLMAAARDEGRPTADEISGAFSAVQGTAEEDWVWNVLRMHWDDVYRDRLVSRVHGGADDDDVRISALACLIVHHPHLLPEILEDLVDAGEKERAVEIAIDLGHVLELRPGEGDPLPRAAESAQALLPAGYAAIADAARVLPRRDIKPAELMPGAAELVSQLAGNSPNVRRLRILYHARLGAVVEPDIVETLAGATIHWMDDQACSEAINAAIALGLSEIVESSVDHMFSSVVAPALKAVGEGLPAPLPQGLLELAKAEGMPVRDALLCLLVAKPHADHLPTLMALAHDEWSSSYRSHDEDDYFPIARQAVGALSAVGGLPAEEMERLDALAIGTTDPGLRNTVFELLAVQGGAPFQERLLDRACSPGRSSIRIAAAHALLFKCEDLCAEVVAKIDAELLATRMPRVASRLMLTTVFCGSDDQVLEMARLLAARPKRRVLVLLSIWATREERPDLSQSLEALFPSDHPALIWLRSGPSTLGNDTLVSDLGDPVVCTEVLAWLNPKQAKA